MMNENKSYKCHYCGAVRDSICELMMHKELWDCGDLAMKRITKQREDMVKAVERAVKIRLEKIRYD